MLNFSLFVSQLYAQGDSLEGRLGGITGGNFGQGEGAFAGFIQAVLNFAVPLGVFFAFVLLGYSAFVMITSAGNPEKLNEAREIATNAIIGAIMIGLSVMVLAILGGVLGIT